MSTKSLWIAVTVVFLTTVAAPDVRATLIAGESFPTKVGGGPGFYTHQIALAGQGNGVTNQAGFAGPYAGTATNGALQPDMNGIRTPAFTGATGGGVQINSPNSRVNRPIAPYTPANTYYFAGTMGGHTALIDGQDTMIDFSNRSATTTGAFAATDRGFQFGLKGPNAIVRARNTAGALTDFVVSNTYSTDLANSNVFVGRLDVDPLGTGVDRLTVYFNATDYTTEVQAAATGTTITFDTDAMSTNADIQYLGFATIGGGGGYTRADELRFATAYADAIAPVPEPTAIAALSTLTLWQLSRRRPTRPT